MNALNAVRLVPAGAVTGVGSLPFADPDDAVARIGRWCPHVPFWPQLPARGDAEALVPQGLPPLAGLVRACGAAPYRRRLMTGDVRDLCARLDEAEATLGRRRASGFYAFERAAERGAFPRAAAIKGQLTGPLTLARCIALRGDACRSLADEDAAADAIARYCTRLAQWQVRRLCRFGRPVLVVIDEPVLPLLRIEPLRRGAHLRRIAEVLDGIRGAGGLTGIHCCTGADVAVLAELEPDVTSFDARRGVGPLLQTPWLAERLRTGGIAAFGSVPTALGPEPTDASALFASWLAAAASLGDPPQVARRTILTATCGLGRVSHGSAERSFELAGRLQTWLHETACCLTEGAPPAPASA